MGEFNSDDHYIYYCGQEFLRRNGVAIVVNKRVWNAEFGGNLKNDTMISVCFQGKPFSITIIQVYALTTNAEKAEVEGFYEDLQDLLVPGPCKKKKKKKPRPFHYRGLECKNRKSRNTWSNRQFGLGVQNEARQRLIEFCQENALVIANTLFQQHKRRLYTWTSPEIRLSIFFAAKHGEALYSQPKQEWELTVWLRSWTPYCQIQT